MYLKQGTLVKVEDQEKPLLKNTDGKVFEVSYIVYFIWEKLDGRTSLKEIDEQIKKVSQTTEDLDSFAKKAVDELAKVDLVKEKSAETFA
ncbi:MAG: hypothetical protein QF441_11050 [Bacteriovoracaceae bacterium]|jgi:hypothetical protein|nr:hypothetical protein [Halobacteriovoraceae bacterium]MDP7321139.1 hypothetical protein [Bacteriovoracaceae bacterium]|tara:strand:+ start:196 stop:465 length:270 start_codon:yes stop_codon:yes gene_type:complete